MSGSRRRILVVEDDAPLAHLYCTALTIRGFAVVRAGDGVSALQSLEGRRPDLILLDLNLPRVGGQRVLQQMSANPLTNDIPIIVITGVDPVPHLPEARMVLRKPCDPDEVARIVSEHLALGSGPT